MIESAIPVVTVTDIQRAEDFYCRVLGFERQFAYRPDPARDNPCYMGVVRDGVMVHVQSFKAERAGLADVFFYVDDVDALFAEISDRGGMCQLPPTNQTWGTREIHVRDPDGNSIVFATRSAKPCS